MEWKKPNNISVDPLEKLIPGDKVYYRNLNLSETQRWVEAKFTKRVSTNILQISIGAHLLMAHRGQIKMVKMHNHRRNVLLQAEGQTVTERGSKRKRVNSEVDEPFRGFDLSRELPAPARRELHPSLLHDTIRDNPLRSSKNDKEYVNVRKSNRKKKKTEHEEFVYYK